MKMIKEIRYHELSHSTIPIQLSPLVYPNLQHAGTNISRRSMRLPFLGDEDAVDPFHRLHFWGPSMKWKWPAEKRPRHSDTHDDFRSRMVDWNALTFFGVFVDGKCDTMIMAYRRIRHGFDAKQFPDRFLSINWALGNQNFWYPSKWWSFFLTNRLSNLRVWNVHSSVVAFIDFIQILGKIMDFHMDFHVIFHDLVIFHAAMDWFSPENRKCGNHRDFLINYMGLSGFNVPLKQSIEIINFLWFFP